MLAFFCLTFLTSCSNSAQRVCQYGMGQSYTLSNDEFEIAATKEIIAPYESLCVPADWSIPINRVLKRPGGTLYICFADTSQKVDDYVSLLGSTGRLVLSRANITVDQQQWTTILVRQNNNFGAQIWKPSKVSNMREVFCYVTSDSTAAQDFIASGSSLSKRLH